MSDEEDVDWRTMALEAVRNGRVDVVLEALKCGGVVLDEELRLEGFEGGKRTTLLLFASQHGCSDVLRVLLRRGARVDIPKNRVPFCLAKNDATKAVFGQYLLEQVATGDFERVRHLLDEGKVDASIRGAQGATALHWAASFGASPELVKLLLDFGASRDLRDDNGSTPEEEAEKNGHAEIVEVLKTYSFGERNGVNSELLNLKRLVEEKELTIQTLRETIEGLLEQDGVRNYVQNLKDEFKAMRVRIQELEKENRELREAPAPSPPVRRTNVSDVDALALDRDRLARELEHERKLRFSQARIHTKVISDLKEEMMNFRVGKNEDREAVQKEEEDEHFPDETQSTGIVSSFFNSLLGYNDDDESSGSEEA